MAATDSYDNPLDPRGENPERRAAGELQARLDEEVCRAERQGTALSCLLVSLDAARLQAEHGEQMPAQALAYAAGALTRQLRCFDRVGQLSTSELLVLLPGADGPRAEIVARRALGRLRAVKVELDGRRHSIGVAIGLGTWSAGLSAAQLLERTRLAARRESARHAPAA